MSLYTAQGSSVLIHAYAGKYTYNVVLSADFSEYLNKRHPRIDNHVFIALGIRTKMRLLEIIGRRGLNVNSKTFKLP